MFVAVRAFAPIAFALALAGCDAKRTPAARSSELRPAQAGAASASASARSSASADPDAGSAPLRPRLVAPEGVVRTPASSVAPADLAAAVRANNAFGVALFGQLRASSKGENLLASPLSASLALTMAYAGARAETAREMAAALQFGGSSKQAMFAGQNALSQELLARAPAALAQNVATASGHGRSPSASDFQLQIVNAIWGQADYPWEAPFLRTLVENYGAGVSAVDFRSQFEPMRLAINAWVSEQTANKINDLLLKGTLDDSARLVLVNALHLKLPWADPFSPSDTEPGPFKHGDGQQSSPKMMHLEHEFAYRDDGSAQIISLPLAGKQLAVLIALPHAGISLSRYESSLHASSPALTIPNNQALVRLTLPKTSFTSESFSVRDALKALGAKQAFDKEHADFFGMCSHIPDGERLYISDVMQKTMIAVQETGVEAAAATAVVVLRAASAQLNPPPPPVPIPMIVNRPYLISVVDVPTGAILLLGQINDPGEGG